MIVRFLKKFGHKFFEFTDDGVTRTVCVDGWINPNCCLSFCHPRLEHGWQSLYDDKHLDVSYVSRDTLTIVCPTCFGYVSSRGVYRNTGPFHMVLDLDKTGLNQFLYNFSIS